MNPFSKFKNLDGNKKKIFMNVFCAMLGKVINMTAALFVGILVARYLGPGQAVVKWTGPAFIMTSFVS